VMVAALTATACGGADDAAGTAPSGPPAGEVRAAVLGRYPQVARDLARLGLLASAASGSYEECTGTGPDVPRPDPEEWRYLARGRLDTSLSPVDAVGALRRAAPRLAESGWDSRDAGDGEPEGTEAAEVDQLVGTDGQLDLTITIFTDGARTWAIVDVAGPCLPTAGPPMVR